MSGSKLPVLYRTDVPGADPDSFKYVILDLDESNAKALGAQAATDANIAGKEFVQMGIDLKRLEPRYINLVGKTAAGIVVRRKWIACDPDNALYAEGGTVQALVHTAALTTETVTFSVSGMVGEKRTVRTTLVDTGLDDGTAA